MKIIRQIHLLLGAIFILAISHVDAQVTSDSSAEIIEYKSLEEALNNPHMVYKLNLSNQSSLVLSDDIWSKFPNLEYLSLKNVGLDEVPYGIGVLKLLLCWI